MRRLPPLPSSIYVLGFILTAVVSAAVVGAWMLERMEKVKRAAYESNRIAAEQELFQATELTVAELDEQAKRLAQWDETRQQLADPGYYDYWRENRALKAGRFSTFVTAVELYRADGTSLSAQPGPMPEHLPKSPLRVTGEGTIELFAPVRLQGGELIGYAGLQADFIRALRALNRFRYVDGEHLSMPPAETPLTRYVELLERLRAEPRAQPETVALERVMHDTLLQLTLLAAVLGTLYYFLFTRLLQRPLTTLARHIDALRWGEAEPLAEPKSCCLRVSEMEKVRQSLNDYQADLQAMHLSLDQKNRELVELTHRDPLTGLRNRRAYDEEWKQLQTLIRGRKIGLTVILIDCDHFKAINDSYGHEVGNELLRSVAGCLRTKLGGEERVYRIGGDEFAIHLLDTTLEDAEAHARQCQVLMGEFPFADLGIKEPVRFSIGLAHAAGDDPDALAQLHKRADIAMYQAKRPGSGKIVLFRPGMDEGADAVLSSRYRHAVYQAIEHGEGIELHYQPILPLADGGAYHEALVRLRDAEGLISPGHIFPIVTTEGLEAEFDAAVLGHLERLLDGGALPAGCALSVNLDGTSLTDPRIHQRLAALERHLPRHPLTLEVTETALIADLKEAASLLQGLRRRGFAVALDDFGSGYSSLRYLSSMPVDIVKFDITMVHDLERTDGQRRIAENVAGMIREAGYKLVAEGIENDSLLGRARDVGFTHAQGFLLGRPAPEIRIP